MPTITPVNFEEVARAFGEAPQLAARYTKTALFRFARRVARRTKREFLHGPPGIRGGRWARLNDKNIQGFTVGNDLSSLKAVSKASRIVRTHIEGATITPKTKAFLFLSNKTGKAGQGAIFARVRSVTLKARVPFPSIWQQEIPKAAEDIQSALHRAVDQALEQRMKTTNSVITRVTAT